MILPSLPNYVKKCKGMISLLHLRASSKLCNSKQRHPKQQRKKTFLISRAATVHFSTVQRGLLSVNTASQNSEPKSIIKVRVSSRKEGWAEMRGGERQTAAPRCRLGGRRWGCKRDLMVGWIREILVTMLNNYGSSRDQSAIDWTPQAFSAHSLGKQRLVN